MQLQVPRSRAVRRLWPRLVLIAVTTGVLLAAPPAESQLQTTFRVFQMTSGCWVDDQDPFPLGDPERYFRFGVFDDSYTWLLSACAHGCTGDGQGSTPDATTYDYCNYDTGCGVWNFTDRTIQKITPDGSGVFFYFGLFDEDADQDDSLGDHWFHAAGPVTAYPYNNNNSPYYPGQPVDLYLCSDRDTEGVGDANNFSVSFELWFEDLSPPVPPPAPRHVDTTVPDLYWNDDDRLVFEWDAALDPNSGISGYVVSLYDDTAHSWWFLDEPVSGGRSVSFCPTGCDFPVTLEEEHVYMFHVCAANGEHPTIANPDTTGSPWISVQQRTGVVDVAAVHAVRHEFALSAPIPNPFSDGVQLAYVLEQAGPVSLAIYDVRGRKVGTVVEGERAAGRHLETWSGRDSAGGRAAPGVYFVRLESREGVRTRRLVRID